MSYIYIFCITKCYLDYIICIILQRVNFRFAPCGLVTLTILPQTFKNSHFRPIVCYGFSILLPTGSKMEKHTIWMELEAGSKMGKP
ncbi:hypothetical protein Hanom_Chr08g00704411 [Helianthus anomalus]